MDRRAASDARSLTLIGSRGNMGKKVAGPQRHRRPVQGSVCKAVYGNPIEKARDCEGRAVIKNIDDGER